MSGCRGAIEEPRALAIYRLVEAMKLNGFIDELDALDLQEHPRATLAPHAGMLSPAEINEVVRAVMPLVVWREGREAGRLIVLLPTSNLLRKQNSVSSALLVESSSMQ